ANGPRCLWGFVAGVVGRECRVVGVAGNVEERGRSVWREKRYKNSIFKSWVTGVKCLDDLQC
nr:hypothetical protein [Tanacetum cinerariifolium]